MIPLIGRLHRENRVVVNIHGRSLLNQSVTDIIKAHRWARQIDTVELSLEETYPLVEALDELELGPASVDLARLNKLHKTQGNDSDVKGWLRDQLADVVGLQGQEERKSQDIVLYGFGRIGRLLARILIERGLGSGLNLRAVVVRKNGEEDLFKRASLLRRDSVHGAFRGTIQVDPETNIVTANGVPIQFIYSSDPATVDYTEYGIDNALITPVLKVLDDEYGVSHGHVETVHSFTNDQNLIDNFHKGDRRGRSAALNMVLTETGAAKAVAKALPQLKGKLTGNAIRVPTPDVSMAILNLQLDEAPDSKDSLNAYLRDMSLNSTLRKQIDYTESHEV
ncbi:MAG: glyceraldehyde-3-phosphate dehydrogenase, partial [Kocuria sp.]|nr:glyceraldehyde-3-phosphate dehydrogenase [Kocuria sp.]